MGAEVAEPTRLSRDNVRWFEVTIPGRGISAELALIKGVYSELRSL